VIDIEQRQILRSDDDNLSENIKELMKELEEVNVPVCLKHM
jgi:hypothetical protein